MNTNNRWIKIVVGIVILELVIGGVIFAYKKLGQTPSTNVSVKDKEIVALYKKIAYLDIDELDVMSPEMILYYGYNNVLKADTINCDVIDIEEDTTGYNCNGITDYVKSADLEKAIRDVYGDKVTITKKSFAIDKNHYAFYHKESDGFVVFEKDELIDVNTYNLKLKEATKEDDRITLTVDVIDGVFGNVLNTYKYTFISEDSGYYLTTKEKIAKD